MYNIIAKSWIVNRAITEMDKYHFVMSATPINEELTSFNAEIVKETEKAIKVDIPVKCGKADKVYTTWLPKSQIAQMIGTGFAPIDGKDIPFAEG